jgi:hypothetical protein
MEVFWSGSPGTGVTTGGYANGTHSKPLLKRTKVAIRKINLFSSVAVPWRRYRKAANELVEAHRAQMA